METKRLLITLLRWIRRILLVVLILISIIIVYMLIGEAITRSKYEAKYPPPGQMINIDTHNIHLHCTGSGKPTVVFEADLDQYGSLSWDSVQGEVAKSTRACSYDRAGIMWSEAGSLPRDGEVIASELATVLDAANEEGPYLLVGHGLGGTYVRIFAGQNPSSVCGIVLLDSSHPDQLTRFAEAGLKKEIPSKQIRPLILLFSHLGMPDRFKGPQYGLSEDIYERQQAFLPKSSMAWFDEGVESPNTLAQARKYNSLGNIPMIVLASARPTGYNSSSGKDMQDIWLELQKDLTLLSKNSELRTFEEVGHYIQFEKPQMAISAIQEIIDQCNLILVP